MCVCVLCMVCCVVFVLLTKCPTASAAGTAGPEILTSPPPPPETLRSSLASQSSKTSPTSGGSEMLNPKELRMSIRREKKQVNFDSNAQVNEGRNESLFRMLSRVLEPTVFPSYCAAVVWNDHWEVSVRLRRYVFRRLLTFVLQIFRRRRKK